jgi:hypothetical protein
VARAVEALPRASAWAALSRVPAPRLREPMRLLDEEQLRAARDSQLRDALGPDGGAALRAYAAERVSPVGGGAQARDRLALAIVASAASFEFGDAVLGIEARTSVAGVLLGPHDELAALLQRVHAAVERGVSAKGAGKLVRMLTLEAGRLRGAAVAAAPEEDAVHRLAKLDAAFDLLAAAAARFNRVAGGSAAAAGAADATARLHEAAEALPDVAAIVTGVLEDVAEAARALGAGREGSAAARQRLLPRIALALYFLGVGVNSFDFVGDMELGATVFLIRDAAGAPHWRYVPPFLLGVRPRPPACVALPSRAQVLISWLVATMPGPTPHLFGVPPPAAGRRR